MAARVSAGLLLYRRTGDGVEVLLAHMGGPFWERRERAWTIPKGEPEPDEDDLLAVAVREFTEELGVAPPPPTSPDLPLGSVRQSGGKVVHAWAREGSVDETSVRSNTVEVEWPPGSGRTLTVPEVDRAAWFTPDDARLAVVAAQAELVERLAQALG
ncbi:NUDIX domain-containing protein [Cellulomonas fimi]|uniref:NUDIX domain-containing protein n=1 Tax=Cellulomonas fimi TaxID=1708 RepID=UPI0023594096|nr:NUDIX domain-containing protein [Cellulomonas fimi]